jgi:hypothetical protein
MTAGHTITLIGLLGNLAGFVLLYKAAAGQAGRDAAQLRGMNHVGLALILGGFGLQFLAAGMFLPK